VTISSSVATAIASGGKLTGWGLKAAAEDGEGTAFPASPRDKQRFFRTDLMILFAWSASVGKWLSVQILTKEFRWTPTTYNISLGATQADATRCGVPSFQGCDDLYLLSHTLQYIISSGASALSASHKWVGDCHKYTSGVAASTIAGPLNIDSGASGTLRKLETPINQLLGGATYFWFGTTWTETGTPGNIQPQEEISYRLACNP
jgi:hypothetical protein